MPSYPPSPPSTPSPPSRTCSAFSSSSTTSTPPCSIPFLSTFASATLYQASGTARAHSGFVNVTKHVDGDVLFDASARYTRPVRQIPYNISILEVFEPILFPGILDAPSAVSSDITSLLENAGCRAFAELLRASRVIKMFESAMDGGITLFVPTDEAFKAPGAPDLSNVTSSEMVSLQYHALPSYSLKATQRSASGRSSPAIPIPAPGSENYTASPPAIGEPPEGSPSESPEADVEKKDDKVTAAVMRPVVGMVAWALFASVAGYCAL